MRGRVSYFQRFSQPENHATNNTLLLLRYFAEVCPSQLQKVLASWIDAQITIGLSFRQQEKMERSVPDGLIRQDPISIYIEAKRGRDLFDDQIERHLASIEATKSAGTIVLIGLKCEEPPQVDEARFVAAAHAKGIVYRGLTFSRILEDLRAACEPSSSEANLILDDFASYLEEEDLLNRRESRLAIFPSGTSYRENLQYGLCYEPAARPCRSATAYIGLYTNKKVIGVGKLVGIAVMEFDKGNPVPRQTELGKITDDQITRLKDCVTATTYYQLGLEELRVYFVDKFEQTEILKSSQGGVMGIRYLDIEALLGKGSHRLLSTKDLAEAVRGKTFE